MKSETTTTTSLTHSLIHANSIHYMNKINDLRLKNYFLSKQKFDFQFHLLLFF